MLDFRTILFDWHSNQFTRLFRVEIKGYREISEWLTIISDLLGIEISDQDNIAKPIIDLPVMLESDLASLIYL